MFQCSCYQHWEGAKENVLRYWKSQNDWLTRGKNICVLRFLRLECASSRIICVNLRNLRLSNYFGWVICTCGLYSRVSDNRTELGWCIWMWHHAIFKYQILTKKTALRLLFIRRNFSMQIDFICTFHWYSCIWQRKISHLGADDVLCYHYAQYSKPNRKP